MVVSRDEAPYEGEELEFGPGRDTYVKTSWRPCERAQRRRHTACIQMDESFSQ